MIASMAPIRKKHFVKAINKDCHEKIRRKVCSRSSGKTSFKVESNPTSRGSRAELLYQLSFHYLFLNLILSDTFNEFGKNKSTSFYFLPSNTLTHYMAALHRTVNVGLVGGIL